VRIEYKRSAVVLFFPSFVLVSHASNVLYTIWCSHKCLRYFVWCKFMIVKKYLEHVAIQLIAQLFHLHNLCPVYWAHWDQGLLFSVLWHQKFGEIFPKFWQNWSNLHEKKENFQNFPKCFHINDKICWGKRKHWLELVSSFSIYYCSGNHP
jgi:hypothetical protein